MTGALNPRNNPEFLSVAVSGQQVMEALKGITTEVIKASKSRFL